MFLVKLFFNVAVIFFLAGNTQWAVAQATLPSDSSVVVVATVNIREAELRVQENNTLQIGFNITNDVGVQPAIKYSLRLTQEIADNQFISDEYVYSDVVSLAEYDSVYKVISYEAPAYISGVHDVWVLAANGLGLGLGSVYLGEVDFGPRTEADSVELDQATCFVSVSDEDVQYTLRQGVDISQTEVLGLTCTVTNYSSVTQIMTPVFAVHKRNVYGELMSTEDKSTQIYTLEAKETKIIEIALPHITKPQAYDTRVSLQTDKIVSNSVVVHSVIQGDSATVQNFTFDKPWYKAGETAVGALFWSGRVDEFQDARGRVGFTTSEVGASVRVLDANGVSCAPDFNQLLNNNDVVSRISLVMTQDCVPTAVAVTLLDENKQVLDGVTLAFDLDIDITPAVTAPAESMEQTSTINYQIILILIGIVGLIILLVMYVVLVRKKEVTMPPVTPTDVLMFLLLTIASFVPVGEVEATTYTVGNEAQGSVTYTINLDKVDYTPGEQVMLTSSSEYTTCGNDSKQMLLQSFYSGSYQTLINSTSDAPSNDNYYNAPLSVDSYDIDLYAAIAPPDDYICDEVTEQCLIDNVANGCDPEVDTCSAGASGTFSVLFNVIDPPDTPADLEATPDLSCGAGEINIIWNDSTEASSYTLRDGLDVIYTGESNSYTHSGLLDGSDHEYTVRANDEGVSSVYSMEVDSVAPPACIVVNLSATVNGDAVSIEDVVSITVGEVVMLSWVSTGADSCSGTNFDTDNLPVATRGVDEPAQGQNTLYTVTCSGETPDVSESAEFHTYSLPNIVPVVSALIPSAGFDLSTGNYDSVSVDYSVVNEGESDASNFSSYIDIDIGNDDNDDPENTVSGNVASLAAGVETVSQSIVLYNNVPFGTHSTITVVDDDLLVDEYDEDNTFLQVTNLLPPNPGMIFLAQEFVRDSSTTTLSWDVLVTYDLDCRVFGPGITTHYFDPEDSLEGPTGSLDTGAITAKSTFVLECTEPITETIFTTDTVVASVGKTEDI